MIAPKDPLLLRGDSGPTDDRQSRKGACRPCPPPVQKEATEDDVS